MEELNDDDDLRRGGHRGPNAWGAHSTGGCRVWAARANGMIDRRPALIVRPAGPEDVVTAVTTSARPACPSPCAAATAPRPPGGLRRRPRDRPLLDARGCGRSGRADGAGPGRRDLG